jgi:class 3 adenylate cyclase
MRHQLVPSFILKNYAAGRLAGRFDAVCLFVDTSGFTPLTTAMMARGPEGAEIVADALIDVFGPLVEAVYAQGGFIAGFAGDAFKVVFPLDQPHAHRRAAAAAWQIRQHMAGRRLARAYSDAFDIAVKVTIADGEVVWGVWEADGRRRTADGGRQTADGRRQRVRN